ncbi:unnamed protein product [Lactuca virosa]|uniref:Uncharacterized protein n=1 Tax=Lactuca virosa TaxID=75947 RepID=A0AAU9MPT8_9ASTR|nr:unnamed protein product [Lactuca virosa]
MKDTKWSKGDLEHFLPKKKPPIDNRKGKGPAIKISQVYKPVIRVEPKKKVTTNMFDTLSHQRVDDTDDVSRIPTLIHSRDPLPASDAQRSSSHGGRISSRLIRDDDFRSLGS